MKIGVISDTHIANKTAGLPKAVLHEFKNVDMILHAGDLVDLCVLDMLKGICPNVKAVFGNMDHAEVREHLTEKLIIEAGKYRLGLMHGHGAPAGMTKVLSAAFKAERPDAIIFGHSHMAFNEKIDGILFFNPGSATDKLFAEYNSLGIIEVNDKIEARIVRI